MNRNQLGFGVVASKLTWFYSGDRNWPDFSVGMKVIWLCRWSKLTWFLNAGRESLGFSEHSNWLAFCVGGPNLLAFCVGGLNWLNFSVGDRIWLGSRVGWNGFGFCGLSNLTSFQCGGSALIWFLCSGRKWLVLVFGLKINAFLCRSIEVDLVLMWGSKLTWFQWWSRNYPGFYVREWNWIGFSVGIEFNFFCAGVKIEFGFVCGPKIICF